MRCRNVSSPHPIQLFPSSTLFSPLDPSIVPKQRLSFHLLHRPLSPLVVSAGIPPSPLHKQPSPSSAPRSDSCPISTSHAPHSRGTVSLEDNQRTINSPSLHLPRHQSPSATATVLLDSSSDDAMPTMTSPNMTFVMSVMTARRSFRARIRTPCWGDSAE